MVSKKLAKKILNAYYDLRFPGSFGGIPVFRKSLQKNRGITISQQALQRPLKTSLHYQVNVTKAESHPGGASPLSHWPGVITQGTGMESLSDLRTLCLRWWQLFSQGTGMESLSDIRTLALGDQQ